MKIVSGFVPALAVMGRKNIAHAKYQEAHEALTSCQISRLVSARIHVHARNPFHATFFQYDKQLVKIALNTHAYESFSLVHWSVTDLQEFIDFEHH